MTIKHARIMATDTSMKGVELKSMSKLGTRIRLQRVLHGISQQQLADAVGVHQTMISGIETYEKNPSIKLLSDLQAYFGVSLLPVGEPSAVIEFNTTK